MGGSLRIPASFRNVVGFRPSLGVIPVQPSRNAWSWLSRSGPLAREVTDIALAMSVLAGPDAATPYSNPVPARRFLEPLQRDLTGLVIGWSDDFGLGMSGGEHCLDRRGERRECAARHPAEPCPRLTVPPRAFPLDSEACPRTLPTLIL
jgi:Asp-tRNA(Asn)/Glu-tRNA(Gln) amidotransferase A subunit family amidase